MDYLVIYLVPEIRDSRRISKLTLFSRIQKTDECRERTVKKKNTHVDGLYKERLCKHNQSYLGKFKKTLKLQTARAILSIPIYFAGGQ
jgi:hypothetical protein